MNTREKFEDMLVNMGMFESQAKQVMELAIPECDKAVPDYKITWDRPAEEYPDVFYKVAFITIKPIARKWIQDNAPKAWYAPMFD